MRVRKSERSAEEVGPHSYDLSMRRRSLAVCPDPYAPDLPPPGIRLQCGYRDVEEAIMPESSIGFMLMLAIFVGIAMALATRYHTDHPLSDLRHWFGAHHRLGRTHRRH